MCFLPKRRWLGAGLTLVAVLIVLGVAGRRYLFFTFIYRGTPADWEFRTIRLDWDRANREFSEAEGAANTPAELNKAREQYATMKRLLVERCLTLSKEHPDTAAELGALRFAACRSPSTEEGKRAGQTLGKRAALADMEHLARSFGVPIGVSSQPVRTLAPIILDRVRGDPTHRRAAQLLADACEISKDGHEGIDAPATFAEAADLIAKRYAESPDIINFCELLGMGFGSPPWAGRFEGHLRTILEVNQDRRVRCAALFALCSVVQSLGESRQVEAEELYSRFVAEFDGEYEYSYQRIEQEYRRRAKVQLDEIRSRGIGKPAPEIVGVDLDGRPMKLSEYRGKVVLLNFWATWCFPCMKLISRERELVKRLEGKPFDVVGVNSDTDEQAVKDAARAYGITWRSFRAKRAGDAPISDDWKVLGYPTLYLIDREGIVRKRWIGSPPPEQLGRAIGQLLDPAAEEAAEREVADLDDPVPQRKPPLNLLSNTSAAGRREGQLTGFLERVYKAPDGYEAKYVVFLPRCYDSEKAFPVILFLHGAGHKGRNGRDQLRGALAEAIRNNEETFGFIAVFPQAHEGDWQADSEDGKRALAILDEVEKEYTVDTKRVYLTGVSMGGEGAWSLAAARPDRWAAIVPICGGGDPKTAAKIKDIPCWCFQGDADHGVVELSREMIRALNKAGGRPLYHEYPGVGHNCWDRTYAMPDLYEWLFEQSLK